MLIALIQILIFPGLLFILFYSLFLSYLDRKISARLQNRRGPLWFQPLADVVKLFGKETVVPEYADRRMFVFMPVMALAAVCAAFLYLPLYRATSLFPFSGDLIVILYLLLVPTLCFALAGWYSNSVYATVGATRILTQFFSYEIPLLISLLAPALLADTWSMSNLVAYYAAHPLYLLLNLPAFLVALVATQGKLQRAPFDLGGADSEIVSGAFVEYSGRLLALFRLAQHGELLVMVSLLAAVFLPFLTGILWLDVALYFAKTIVLRLSWRWPLP